MKQAYGRTLEFISRIKRDGSGTEPADNNDGSFDDTLFNLQCLSITLGTWIASEFNSYVVKLKTTNS